MSIKHRIQALTCRDDINSTDVLLAALFAWWGLWMVLPGSAIEDSPIYGPMFKLAPSQLWGLLMLGVAVLKVWAIARCHWRLRVALLIMLVAFWSFLATQIWTRSPNTPGWGLLGIVAIVAFWRMLQIAATGDDLNGQCELTNRRGDTE